jgi:metal-sulfur cluster biosynthetic enzyme
MDAAVADSSKDDPFVLQILRRVEDPEMGVNIVDLGLVYRASRTLDAIRVKMTLTTRACPLGEMIAAQARALLHERFPSAQVDVALVWDPLWTVDRITPEGRKQLYV